MYFYVCPSWPGRQITVWNWWKWAAPGSRTAQLSKKHTKMKVWAVKVRKGQIITRLPLSFRRTSAVFHESPKDGSDAVHRQKHRLAWPWEFILLRLFYSSRHLQSLSAKRKHLLAFTCDGCRANAAGQRQFKGWWGNLCHSLVAFANANMAFLSLINYEWPLSQEPQKITK